MTTDLTLTHAEERVLASALHHEHGRLSKLRADAEHMLARGNPGVVDWAEAASSDEKRLATLDGLVSKLPAWVHKAVSL